MSTTLSSATAAAKAAQAELTAPVAANNPAPASGKSSAAAGKPATTTESTARPAASKPAPAAPANQAATTGTSRQPAQAANQPDSRSAADAAQSAAQAAAQAAADAVPVAAPLFSALLNLADVAADSGSDSAAPTDSDESTGSGSAAAGNVLPAMITSLLNTAAPAPAPATPAASPADSSSVDAISASATLNSSATRLNLAAASVAVVPAAPAVDDTAAMAAAQTSAVASPAAAPQSVYAQTNNATLAAVAARQSESAAPAPASSDSAAPAVDSDATVPLAASTANTAPLRESWVNGARVVTRAADSSAAPAANAPAGHPATAASIAGDERSFTLAGTGISANHASAAGQAAAPATASTGTVVLNGTPEQWQQPLRAALGDRLQLQLQRNNDQAVIRLEPPNMGSIEISIRHSAGALQVNLSANNSEVLRQLNTIGDSVRQDLSSRQFSDVAVTVSSSRAQAQADQGGQGGRGQQRGHDDGRTPGRALNEDDSTATFAMTGE